ncbi:MAG TPA: hypothetical protein VHM89_02120 [Acidimicrobiales bacterium]|nr:hypothetical protein [Acidimicrobiales bacterium]
MQIQSRRRGPRSREGGFTIIELTVAMGLAAFVFAALASLLGASLRTLAVQKARTEGNEVATQGIEELQRLAYPALGVCTSAPDPPDEFVLRAPPLNCPSPVPAGYGEDPCNVTTAGAGVPKPVYACLRNNITYNVRRYVAWGDPGQTTKRMAVFVNWVDRVGRHEVSQQSSLRAPGQSDLFGLEPPAFSGIPTANPSTVIVNGDGTLPNGTSVVLSATTTNLVSTDKVFAVFNTIDDDGNETSSSKMLSSGNGSSWTGTISDADGFRFGAGTMFYTFSAIRVSDGKANSTFTGGTNKFCAPPDTTCGGSQYPRLTAVTVAPSSDGPNIGVDASGTLGPDRIDFTASTTNTQPADRVAVTFQTSAGAVTTLLQSTSPTCDATTTCTWSGSVSKNSGYGFPAGTRKFYFSVNQIAGGATASAASPDKVFELR